VAARCESKMLGQGSIGGKQRLFFDIEKKRGDYGENKQGLHNTVNKKRITGIPEETYINGKLQ
jgi:hypothetical protein